MPSALPVPILLIALGQTVVWAGLYYIFPALILSWEGDPGFSREALTLIFSLALGLAALASPRAGRLIDRGLGAHLMAGSALAGAAALALLPLAAGSAWAFGAVWLLIGLAMAGCLYEPCFALLVRTRGTAARRAITLVTLIAGFASSLAFPLAGWLAAGPGWPVAAQTFALMIALIGAPALWFGARRLEAEARPAAAAEDRRSSPSLNAIAARPGVAALALAFATVALVHGIVIGHLLPILSERGVSGPTALLAASMIGPMQVAGRLAMMAGDRWLPARPAAVVCLLGMGLAQVALLGAAALPLLTLFVVLQGACYGTMAILRPVVAAERLGRDGFGATAGVLALPYIAASAIAPFLGALIWRIGGYDTVLIVTALTAVLGAGFLRRSSHG